MAGKEILRLEPLNLAGTHSTASLSLCRQSGTQSNASLPVPPARFLKRGVAQERGGEGRRKSKSQWTAGSAGLLWCRAAPRRAAGLSAWKVRRRPTTFAAWLWRFPSLCPSIMKRTTSCPWPAKSRRPWRRSRAASNWSLWMTPAPTPHGNASSKPAAWTRACAGSVTPATPAKAPRCGPASRRPPVPLSPRWTVTGRMTRRIFPGCSRNWSNAISSAARGSIAGTPGCGGYRRAWRGPRGWVTRASYTTSFGEILPVTYQQIRNNLPGVRYVQVQNPDLVNPLRDFDLSKPGRSSATVISPDLVSH